MVTPNLRPKTGKISEMERNSNKSMRWENPKLTDLSKGKYKTSYGICTPGSGNVIGSCNIGGLASSCDEGASAFSCDGGMSAVFGV